MWNNISTFKITKTMQVINKQTDESP